jgi:hypothetical protein
MRCPWLQAETKVATILVINLLSSSFHRYSKPQMGCHMVSNFCMGSKIKKIWLKNKIWTPNLCWGGF